MDAWQKIDLLGEAARNDICRGCGTHSSSQKDDIGRWIYPAIRPDGKRVRLLKILQTNVCVKDCRYCANRSQRDVRRATFGPDELAKAFDELVRSGLAEGLFLSSGVCGNANHAMERMLATAEILRRHYRFGGYLHLKILPGTDRESIRAAVRIAQRVSVNLEAPNAQRLHYLSAAKDYEELLGSLKEADRQRQELGCAVSITTQFVAGGAGESDRELLMTSAQLYAQLRLARAYYSAFQPVQNTPLENQPPTPTWREHRLYQADFLLRQYGFQVDELPFDAQGNLPRGEDPKLSWARRHPECFPIEVNTAERQDLLRVPGIGPRYAQRILARRKQGTLSELKHLGLSKACAQRAAPFILLNGKAPLIQRALWPVGSWPA